MKKISNTIYSTYVSAFQQLSPPTRLHFASRLSQWDNDELAEQLLGEVVTQTRPAVAEEIRHQLSRLLQLSAADQPAVNEYSARAAYFATYPQLFGLHQALFQVRNWLFHYNIDARDTLRSLPEFPDYRVMIEQLLLDTEALQVLSTYTVNTIYLARRLLDSDENSIFSVRTIRNIASTISTNHTPQNDLLLLYFVTHCILGDTLFYKRPVPAAQLADYWTMLTVAEETIGDRLEALTLDAQFELLVAHKLCSTSSPQENAILQRGQGQFDTKLGFIVDPKRPTKNTLETAEHRNVLFLMANRPCKLAPI